MASLIPKQASLCSFLSSALFLCFGHNSGNIGDDGSYHNDGSVVRVPNFPRYACAGLNRSVKLC
jgi:hypothetical protein